MLKKLPRKKTFYVILLLYVLAVILYVAGHTILGVSTGALTALIAIWKHLASEKASQDEESLYLTQARMLVTGGLGNVFVESIKDEISQPQSIWPLDPGSRLDKALAIEPDNQFAMSHNAVLYALGVSVHAGRGWPIEWDRIQYIRSICRKGRKLYPTEPLFCDALGILADAMGNHKRARAWFERASKVDPQTEPFWRLRIATSYSMTGEHSEALKQLELAKSTDLSNWVMDFLLGRTLCSLGRYDEALEHLRLARRQRKLRSDIVMWMRTTQNSQMRIYRSAYYSLIFILLLLIREPKFGLWNLAVFPFCLISLTYRLTCRRLYLMMTTVWPSSARQLEKVLNPDMLEIDIADQLARDSMPICAENVCRTGLRFVPDSVRLLNNLAMNISKQGRLDEAVETLDKALVLYPKNEVLLHNRNAIITGLTGRTVLIDARDTGNKER